MVKRKKKARRVQKRKDIDQEKRRASSCLTWRKTSNATNRDTPKSKRSFRHDHGGIYFSSTYLVECNC